MSCNCEDSNPCLPDCCCLSNFSVPYAHLADRSGSGGLANYMQVIAENHVLNYQIKQLEKNLCQSLEENKALKEKNKNKEKEEGTTNCAMIEKLLKEEQKRSTKYANELDELRGKFNNFTPPF